MHHVSRCRAAYSLLLAAMSLPAFAQVDFTGGDKWFTVTTVVENPKNLIEPFLTSTHFKKIPSGAGLSPSVCTAK